ncbi:unnamed protein product [Cladocopium goreaui]|uniref:Uncharacterized protein n=1 Tax=Cladocopium goreaui TaxID=2562237 RepID=A0A9P1DQP4_9DINO|nr:unnamed protein product [Cladocopium goreaui]
MLSDTVLELGFKAPEADQHRDDIRRQEVLITREELEEDDEIDEIDEDDEDDEDDVDDEENQDEEREEMEIQELEELEEMLEMTQNEDEQNDGTRKLSDVQMRRQARVDWKPEVVLQQISAEELSKAKKLSRAAMYMHHITAPWKQRFIKEAAKRAGLSGICVFGKPGRILVEGPLELVSRYAARIKSWPWKRCDLQGPWTVDGDRAFHGFREIKKADFKKEVAAAGLSEQLKGIRSGYEWGWNCYYCDQVHRNHISKALPPSGSSCLAFCYDNWQCSGLKLSFVQDPSRLSFLNLELTIAASMPQRETAQAKQTEPLLANAAVLVSEDMAIRVYSAKSKALLSTLPPPPNSKVQVLEVFLCPVWQLLILWLSSEEVAIFYVPSAPLEKQSKAEDVVLHNYTGTGEDKVPRSRAATPLLLRRFGIVEAGGYSDAHSEGLRARFCAEGTLKQIIGVNAELPSRCWQTTALLLRLEGSVI